MRCGGALGQAIGGRGICEVWWALGQVGEG